MPGQAQWLATLEQRARDSLAPALVEYLLQGARESVSAGEAVAAWGRVRFRPRVLHDVTHVDPGTTLLGQRSALPFGVAPTTLQRLVHPEGEVAMARATADAGGVLVVSSNCGTRFADIATTGVHWWLQIYLPEDRTLAEPLLDRAVEAGAAAIVLTVDTPVVGTKYASPDVPVVWDTVEPGHVRVNFDEGYDDRPGSAKALDLGPHDIGWLAARTGRPVVVKGVLRAEDADRAVQAGAAAVWVSNHGGRQLDRAASTASCLPEVVDAVGDRAQVYVDGGIRSGLDVLAGLALGADAVFLGRLPALALVDGVAGVAALHQELLDQTVDALRLAGCRTPADARGLAAPGGAYPV
ncbi:MAG: alpha-hydroxy-acid oxidizing protein [Nocardioides sp.]